MVCFQRLRWRFVGFVSLTGSVDIFPDCRSLPPNPPWGIREQVRSSFGYALLDLFVSGRPVQMRLPVRDRAAASLYLCRGGEFVSECASVRVQFAAVRGIR